MSERAAARYYLTGETFDASQAAASGLITEAAADVDTEIATITDALRACAPQGLAETKPLTTRATLAAFAERDAELQALSARLFASAEAREGMLAFIERRPPAWAAPS
jgi:enoyl-CoA hydratase